MTVSLYVVDGVLCLIASRCRQDHARRLDRLAAKDFHRRRREWRKPLEDGGAERVRREYGCIQALRIVLGFGIESGIAPCRQLGRDMDGMRFAKNPAREKVATFAQVEAFVDEALRQGEFGLAMAQSLQFECFLRQGDVVGNWRAESSSYSLATGEVRDGHRVWRGQDDESLTP